MAVSATLAAHQVVEERRRAGLPVLPMSFGQAGVPVHPLLGAALADAAGHNAYGPVAGEPALREAAAGYWSRRGLPTDAGQVVVGPGSKSLLYASLLAVSMLDPANRSSVGGGVVLPRPSWVSYAQQAALTGGEPIFLPTRPGQGGVVDPDRLAEAVRSARAAGRHVRAMVLTLPDNPTGRLAEPATVREICELARELDLVLISDEIYRDLTYAGAEFVSPAEFAPERTIVTTGLSKSLALGGWRVGVARFPDVALRERVVSIASEIWSCASQPVQHAAAVAFGEPTELVSYVDSARRLYEKLNKAVASRFAVAGALVAEPQAAFYCYPDFEPWRDQFGSGAELAARLLARHGVAVLPGHEFGEAESSLAVRVATGQLTGDTDEQRREALAAADPLRLPWVAGALDRLSAACEGLR